MKFEITVSETLQKVVSVDAGDSNEAENIAENNWRAGDYILGAEHFTGVEFKARPIAA